MTQKQRALRVQMTLKNVVLAQVPPGFDQFDLGEVDRAATLEIERELHQSVKEEHARAGTRLLEFTVERVSIIEIDEEGNWA